jgi:hypothetical protein
VFVRLVNASNGRNVIAKVLVIASCIAILEVRRQPNAWSPYLSNVEPQIHFIVSAIMMGRRSFRCTSSVNVSLFMRLEGSLLGRLCSAMLVRGLRRLGRNVLISFGSSWIWSTKFFLVNA